MGSKQLSPAGTRAHLARWLRSHDTTATPLPVVRSKGYNDNAVYDAGTVRARVRDEYLPLPCRY